MKIEYELIT